MESNNKLIKIHYLLKFSTIILKYVIPENLVASNLATLIAEP